MNEGERRLVREAEGLRRRALTPAQEARRVEVDARSERIQVVGPRPSDGVTFGSGKVPEEKKRARGR